jgi:hypothetical protein
MRNQVLALTLAAVLTMSFGATGAQPQVTGLWLGTARSAGGLGNWLELHPGGTATFSFGAIVEGTYRVSDQMVWVTAGEPPSEAPWGHLEIDGDKGVRTPLAPTDAPRTETLSAADQEMLDRTTKPIQMRRIGAAQPGAPAIVGTWQYAHYTGGTAFETFTKAGHFLLRVQMQTTNATYTETPKGVRVTLPRGELSLTFNGDVLVSPAEEPGTSDGPRAEGMVFRRAPR